MRSIFPSPSCSFAVAALLMGCASQPEALAGSASQGDLVQTALEECKTMGTRVLIAPDDARSSDDFYEDARLSETLGDKFIAVTFADRATLLDMCEWLTFLATDPVNERVATLRASPDARVSGQGDRIDANRQMLAYMLPSLIRNPEQLRGVRTSDGKLQAAGQLTHLFLPFDDVEPLWWTHVVTRPSNLPGLEDLVSEPRVRTAGTASAVVVAQNALALSLPVMAKPVGGTEALFAPLGFQPYGSSWYRLELIDAAMLIVRWGRGETPQQVKEREAQAAGAEPDLLAGRDDTTPPPASDCSR